MTAPLVSNNASTTVVASIVPATTTINLTPGTGALFPALSAGQHFWGTFQNSAGAIEVVQVTARSTDALTVVRAQDNTAAGSWNPGDKFELRPCAALFNDIIGLATAQGRLINVQVFTGAGTYTPTAGTNSIIVDLQAAGAGSAGLPANSASLASISGAGSTGGYMRHRFTSGFSGLAYSVGAGGAAGTSGGGIGGTGGNTTFGSLTATGATGQVCNGNITNGAALGGAPGDATGGNIINLRGIVGADSWVISSAGIIITAQVNPSAFGGGRYGWGAPGVGSGGGGAAEAGSPGGSGIIIVYEYA